MKRKSGPKYWDFNQLFFVKVKGNNLRIFLSSSCINDHYGRRGIKMYILPFFFSFSLSFSFTVSISSHSATSIVLEHYPTIGTPITKYFAVCRYFSKKPVAIFSNIKQRLFSVVIQLD